MTLPTFLIAGAPKAGTTALWAYLNEHPDVYLPETKEPRFFSKARGELERGVVGSGPARSGHYYRGLDWYEGLFAAAGGAPAVGEASTFYFFDEESPALIKATLPDVKLIFLLRDPVERMYSHYWQEYKLGWTLPSFEDMVLNDHPRLEYYARASSYAANLERFFSAFPREQILVILNDDLQANTVMHYREVCRFLGISEDFTPRTIGRRFNQQVIPRWRGLQVLLSAARGSRMSYRMPANIRALLGRLARTIHNRNVAPAEHAPLAPQLRHRLVSRFAADIDYVEKLLGRDLSHWRAVEPVQRPQIVA